jgi:hypothetical protein
MKTSQNDVLAGWRIALGIISMAAMAWQVEATIGSKNSVDFNFKYEMDNVAQGVDPAASTSAWGRFAGGSPAPTASLSGGLLNINSSANVGQGLWWETPTTVGNNALGATIEVRLRINSSLGSGTSDQVLQLWLGESNDLGHLAIGASHAYWYVGPTLHSILNSQANNDGFHDFRIYEDSSTTLYNVSRDGTTIATGLPATFGSIGITTDRPMMFGDGSSDWGGNVDIEYVRFDTTGGYVPEPSSVALLAMGAFVALVLRRRR